METHGLIMLWILKEKFKGKIWVQGVKYVNKKQKEDMQSLISTGEIKVSYYQWLEPQVFLQDGQNAGKIP